MFHKLMRALGDGYRSMLAELEDTFGTSETENAPIEPEKPVDPALRVALHDCADDLKALR